MPTPRTALLRISLVIVASVTAVTVPTTGGRAGAQGESGVVVAGFRFGWSASETHAACEGAGESYSVERVAGAVVERCSAPLADAGFPRGSEVVLNFCGDHLCRLAIIANVDGAVVEPLVTTTRRRLVRKYGEPVTSQGRGHALHTTTFERMGVGTSLDQTARVQLSVSPGSGRRMVSLSYISRRQLEEEERRELQIIGAL